jgi:4-hydroxybenzoyl-CoA reductase subunit beta
VLRLPPFRYLQPRGAREAACLLADHGPDAMAVAGGTDLYPNMKRRQFTPKVLVGLRGLPGAARIVANGSLTLGAMATLSDVAAHPVVRGRWPSVARAAGLVSSPPLRNAGTIGGNLCVDTRCNYYNQTEFWRASVGYCMKKDGDVCLVAPGSDKCWALSSSDTAPVMIALGAEVGWSARTASAGCPSRSSTGGTASRTWPSGPTRC